MPSKIMILAGAAVPSNGLAMKPDIGNPCAQAKNQGACGGSPTNGSTAASEGSPSPTSPPSTRGSMLAKQVDKEKFKAALDKKLENAFAENREISEDLLANLVSEVEEETNWVPDEDRKGLVNKSKKDLMDVVNWVKDAMKRGLKEYLEEERTEETIWYSYGPGALDPMQQRIFMMAIKEVWSERGNSNEQWGELQNVQTVVLKLLGPGHPCDEPASENDVNNAIRKIKDTFEGTASIGKFEKMVARLCIFNTERMIPLGEKQKELLKLLKLLTPET